LLVECSFQELGGECVSVVIDVLGILETSSDKGVDHTSPFDLIAEQEARVGALGETLGRKSEVH
jgi:hypothetical protein